MVDKDRKHAMPFSRSPLHRRLKLRHLHLLDMLNATRSMRVTASRLGISPAAVSKSCLEVEDLLGRKLFERIQGRLVPLPGLERIVLAARRIDHELIALGDDFQRATALMHGTVRIGLQAPMLEKPLVQWIMHMKAEQPFLTLSIEYGMRTRLLDDLHAGRLDLVAINLFSVAASGRFRTRTLCLEHCFVLADGQVHAVFHVLDNWASYADRLWLLPLKGMAMRDRFDVVLAERDLSPPERLIELGTPSLHRHLVPSDSVTMLIPASLLTETEHPGLSGLEGSTIGDEFYMEHGIAWAKGARSSPQLLYAIDVMSTLPGK